MRVQLNQRQSCTKTALLFKCMFLFIYSTATTLEAKTKGIPKDFKYTEDEDCWSNKGTRRKIKCVKTISTNNLPQTQMLFLPCCYPSALSQTHPGTPLGAKLISDKAYSLSLNWGCSHTFITCADRSSPQRLTRETPLHKPLTSRRRLVGYHLFLKYDSVYEFISCEMCSACITLRLLLCCYIDSIYAREMYESTSRWKMCDSLSFVGGLGADSLLFFFF